MSIKVVLFDLDGTLLPMDQDLFVKTYFGLLAKKLVPHGYEPKKLIDGIWAGTSAMVKNDGSKSNEEAFWETFSGIYGPEVKKDMDLFDEFYRAEFAGAKAVCGYNPKSAEVIEMLKGMGVRIVLATNPLFPKIATENRIRWAGLAPEDFEFFTTYEGSSYCKPNINYYMEIVKKLNVRPEECLMVGNDVTEDMVVEKIGMQAFLLTDCLINKEQKDISVYPNGSFQALIDYIRDLVK